MTKISLVEKLKIHAKGKYPHFVNGGEFELLAQNEGFKSSNASRRLRELANVGILERRLNGKSVEYRWINKEQVVYRPSFITHERKELTKLFT